MRLLTDANLSPRVAAALTSAGHDVVDVLEIGLAGASDEAILARAGSEQRVIVSSDTDFGAPPGTPRPSYVILGAAVHFRAIVVIRPRRGQ